MSKTKELTADAEVARLKTLIVDLKSCMDRVQVLSDSTSDLASVEGSEIVYHLTGAINGIDDACDKASEL